ncbi:hypothetical protein [Thalassospira sp.]|uniref:hypothetical protein n=1 Tax=Thalassospira sp. TaxID=1912094 RepID=UPI003AA8351C
MTFQRNLITGLLGASIAAMAGSGSAHAQSDGGFLKVSAAESPVHYHPPFNAQAVYLRQVRTSSTVSVARWLDQSDEGHTSNQIYIESVFSETSPGFAFRTDTPPAKLLGMFETLQNKSRQNGESFSYQTPSGPIMVLPFARDNAQCISFSGRWEPTRADQRGSQLLGYFCEPIAVQTAPKHQAPAQQMDPAAARDFAASFFLRFEINLPGDIGAPVTDGQVPVGVPAVPANPNATAPTAAITGDISSPETAPQTTIITGEQTNTTISPDEGIGIMTRWNNIEGRGALKFDKPAGEGTMIIDDANRHCEGYWQHKDGRYNSATLPFGNWAIFCTDGTSARGTYTSSSPSQVKGDGQDNTGQPVLFRQAGQ